MEAVAELDGLSPAEQLLMQVFQQLLEEVRKEGGAISDEQLKALEALFPDHLLAAVDLVERGAVTSYSCTTQYGYRTLYQVRGNTGHLYTCFRSSRYCSCPAFVYSVLMKSQLLLCKHQLAVHLAQAMADQDMCRNIRVSGEEWSKMAEQDKPTSS